MRGARKEARHPQPQGCTIHVSTYTELNNSTQTHVYVCQAFSKPPHRSLPVPGLFIFLPGPQNIKTARKILKKQKGACSWLDQVCHYALELPVCMCVCSGAGCRPTICTCSTCRQPAVCVSHAKKSRDHTMYVSCSDLTICLQGHHDSLYLASLIMVGFKLSCWLKRATI